MDFRIVHYGFCAFHEMNERKIKWTGEGRLLVCNESILITTTTVNINISYILLTLKTLLSEKPNFSEDFNFINCNFNFMVKI